MISDESLQKLRKLLEEDGYYLTDEELLTTAVGFVGLMETVYRPIKKEWLEELEKRWKP